MPCPSTLCYIEEEAADLVEVTPFLADVFFLISLKKGAVFLPLAACLYLTKATKPKDGSFCSFNAAVSHAITPLCVAFAEIINGSPSKYEGMSFHDFQMIGIPVSSRLSSTVQAFFSIRWDFFSKRNLVLIKSKRVRISTEKREHRTYAKFLIFQKKLFACHITHKSHTGRHARCSKKTKPRSRYDIFQCEPFQGTSKKKTSFCSEWNRPRCDCVESSLLTWNSLRWGAYSWRHYEGWNGGCKRRSCPKERVLATHEDAASWPPFQGLYFLLLYCRMRAWAYWFIGSGGFSWCGTPLTCSNFFCSLSMAFQQFCQCHHAFPDCLHGFVANNFGLPRKWRCVFNTWRGKAEWNRGHMGDLDRATAKIVQRKLSAAARHMQREFAAAFAFRHQGRVKGFGCFILHRNADCSPNVEVSDVIAKTWSKSFFEKDFRASW